MTSTFRGFRWWLGSCCLVLLAGLEAAGQLPVGQPRNERSQPILAWGRPARRGELPGQAVAIADFLARPELAQAQTVAGSCHVLLHLPQPLSLAQQQALAQAGVTLGEYFRENCWWAQMAGQVNLAALRQANLHQVVLPGPGHKASPLLVANNLPASARTVPGQVDMLVVTPIQLPENQLHKEITQRGGELRFYHAGLGLAHVRAPEAQLAQVVASPWVRWAEPLPPDPELQDEPSRQAHQANVLGGTLGGLARNLTGQGVKIGVWDGGYFPGHLDLANRVEVVRPGSPNTAWMQHGTRVTGIMAGSGTRLPFARGIAPEAQVFFHGNISGQSVLLPANYAPYTMFEAVERQGIVITQNSYGPLPPTPYGNAARALDQIVNLHPQVFHTHAAGNYGSGFNSVVNVAKNLLAVGNADINGQIYFQSSRGPAMDGRLFPHVVATGVGVFGTDNPATFVYSPGTGTSFACPQASGMAALLYQRFGQLHGGQTPDATLIKTLLCNGADDLGNPGPDYTHGFGRLNGLRAVEALEQGRYRQANVLNNQQIETQFTVPVGGHPLKVLLGWNDPAAYPTSGKTLVNDLDLVLISPGGTEFRPWVLDPANPGGLGAPGTDTLNNQEQVLVASAQAGTWTARVRGRVVRTPGGQAFSLTWLADSPRLTLTWPNGGEAVSPFQEDYRPNGLTRIHWQAVGLSGDLTLEFSADGGNTWTLVSNTLPAGSTFADWQIPPTTVTGQGRFRLTGTTSGGQTLSDQSDGSFTVMDQPNWTFNWGDPLPTTNQQLALRWRKVLGATHYDVLQYQAASRQWQPLAQNLTDTSYLTPALTNGDSAHWFTVRAKALLNGHWVVSERAPGVYTRNSGANTGLDVALAQVTAGTLSPTCGAGQTAQTVRIKIVNQGSVALVGGTTLPAQYQLNGGPPVAQNFTLAAALPPGGEIELAFATPVDLSVPQAHELRATAHLPGDLFPANNAAQLSYTLSPPPVVTAVAHPGAVTANGQAVLSLPALPVTSYTLNNITFAPANTAAIPAYNFGGERFSQPVEIGFPFRFYDDTYQQVYLTNQGLISFDGYDLSYINEAGSYQAAIPSRAVINNYIAAAWSNLRNGTVKYGTVGQAPRRVFVVSFEGMEQNAAPNGLVTTQIQLFEGTHHIEIHTTQVDAHPQAMTMGIESRRGDYGTAVPGRNNQVWAGAVTSQAVRFVPTIPGLAWPDLSSIATFTTPGGGRYAYGYQLGACAYSGSIEVFNPNDAQSPTVVSLEPTPGSTNVPLTLAELKITFNENVRLGTGNLTIMGGATPLVINVQAFANGSPVVQVAGPVATIRVPVALTANTDYYVLIDNQAFIDYGWPGNAFMGIGQATVWPFSTRVVPTVVWQNDAWSPQRPDASTHAEIHSAYPNGQPGEGSFVARDLRVVAGATLTIGNGQGVVVHGNLHYPGRIEVAHAGSLVQKSGSNLGNTSGTFVLQKTGRTQVAYNFWASPVALFLVQNLTSYQGQWRFTYHEPTNQWQPAHLGPMRTGHGYTAVQTGTFSFSGVPHNGPYGVDSVERTQNAGADAHFYAGYHLLGNPYPSPLDLATWFADNPQLTGTVWLWNDNGLGAGQGNYVAVNLLNDDPQIATTQGFFARRAPGSGSNQVQFHNGQRVVAQPPFYRTEAPERLRLLVHRADGLRDQVLLGFHPDFSPGIDAYFDGEKMDGNPQLSLAALHNGGRYANTALPPLGTESNWALPLHLKITQAGTYRFEADASLPGTGPSHPLFLEDRQANEWYYLQPGREHALTLAPGNYRDRFFLRRSGEVVGARPATPAVYAHGPDLFVRWPTTDGPAQVAIYDLLGRLVGQFSDLPAGPLTTQLAPRLPQSGVYVVKLTTATGPTERRVWLEAGRM